MFFNRLRSKPRQEIVPSDSNETDSERFQKFASIINDADKQTLQEIRIATEQYGELSPENTHRVKLIKQHFIDQISKTRYDFSSAEVEDYTDKLLAPNAVESAPVASEPVPTYRVVRTPQPGEDLEPTRFDLGDIPNEDLR